MAYATKSQTDATTILTFRKSVDKRRKKMNDKSYIFYESVFKQLEILKKRQNTI